MRAESLNGRDTDRNDTESGSSVTGSDSDSDTAFVLSFPPSPYDEGPPFTRAEYPPLPDGAEQDDTYYLLGWPDNEKAWKRIMVGLTGDPDRASPRADNPMGAILLHRFLWLDVVEYPHFWLFNELEVPPCYFDKPRTLFAGSETDSEPNRSDVVVICVSHPAYLHGCRLTQNQYDYLVNLFGEEPVWYKDHHKKATRATPGQPILDWHGEICHDCHHSAIPRG